MMAVCTTHTGSAPPTSSSHTPVRELCTKTGLHVLKSSTETWRETMQSKASINNKSEQQLSLMFHMAVESSCTVR